MLAFTARAMLRTLLADLISLNLANRSACRLYAGRSVDIVGFRRPRGFRARLRASDFEGGST
jgi:hypothetical protein